jgi:hypothetical protein
VKKYSAILVLKIAIDFSQHLKQFYGSGNIILQPGNCLQWTCHHLKCDTIYVLKIETLAQTDIAGLLNLMARNLR